MSILAFIPFRFDRWQDYYKPHDGEWFDAFHRLSRRCISELFLEVFKLFKGYLISLLVEKGKQFERSAKSNKEAANIKYKGNQKQFEVNLRLVSILTQIKESASSPADIHKLVAEAKLITKKHQKLIKITDRNRDGWLVVQQVWDRWPRSDSEDEKIRKAKAAAGKKQKQRRVTSVTLWKNLSHLVIFSFFAVTPLLCLL